MVNRYWGYLMGKGLVNPIDDLRETNPPTNPELLDALADAFIASGYDLKALLRLILTSRVYQLSALTTPDNRLDTTFFTHYTIKRLTAEQLLDAIDAATGTVEKFPKLPAGTRAISVPDTHLCVVLPRHVRPAAASHRLRVRTIERPEPEPGPQPDERRALESQAVPGRRPVGRMLKDPKLTDAGAGATALLVDVQPAAHRRRDGRRPGRSSPRRPAVRPAPRTCSGRCSIPRNFCSTIDRTGPCGRRWANGVEYLE